MVSRHTEERRTTGSKMQVAATAVGLGFLVVGILGFIPGVTSNFDQMEFAGHESGAMLLGIFAVSVLHNIVHLLFGVFGLAMSRTWSAARAYLIGGGVIYLLLTAFGLLIDFQSDANFVPFNSADNWLHLILGVGMIALGLILSSARFTHRRLQPDSSSHVKHDRARSEHYQS